MTKKLLFIYFLFFACEIFSQSINGVIKDEFNIGLPNVFVKNVSNSRQCLTDLNGKFTIHASLGDSLRIKANGYTIENISISELIIKNGLNISLKGLTIELETFNVTRKRLEKFDVGTLPPIKGVQITTGTNAVIELENLSGAKSTANPREMFAKIPGLNIWESDGAGIQIGIGGRGLSPNRAANFNTRQNGYDISADALGYPESYYSPPFEALKSIEIIRGSASLQFGTQFGGLLNFIIKEPPTSTPLEITSRNTGGNYGYFSTFNRIAGSNNKLSYQVYHQYKKGDGYRENSSFYQHQGFAQIGYYIKENIKIRFEYTHMSYLAQQAGGLTDFQFNKDPLLSYRNRNWFQVNWNMLAMHFDYEISSKSIFNIRAFGMKSSRESLGFLGKISQADPNGNRELIQGLFQNGGAEARYLQRYQFNPKKKETFTKGAFLVGMRFYEGNTISNQGSASNGNDANFSFINPKNLENSSFSFPSKNVAAFIENILFVNKNLTVNFGLRYEYITSSANGFYKRYSIHPVNSDTLGVYTMYDSNYVKRNVPLFGAGVSYKVGKMSSIYANFTKNYRAINFTDIRVNNPNIVVDSLMKDEYGYTGEFGFRGLQKKYLTFDLALFYVFYGNKIGLAPKSGTTYKERTNIGDAVNLGLEAFAEIDLIGVFKDSAKHNLNLFVNLAYIDAKYVNSKEPNYIGKQVEYVSPFIFKTGIKWKHSKFAFQVQMSYNSDQFSDASNSITPSGDAIIGVVPSYMVFDFSSKYVISKCLQFEVGVNNFTNEQYFTRRATAYPGPGILPSDGISGYLTLQYQFNVKRK
jgi:Fe(3+) dicitrate transport protein